MSTHPSAQRWMDEAHRPQFHYTAEKNMINDPNGLVFYDGEWHLFHQYNQHEVVHWGHAVSTDLFHWEHLGPAIFPDALGQIYSGTIVVDTANTSGLRNGMDDVFIAFFTYADHHDGTQSQGLAFSNDRGRTWTPHEANPIIANPGRRDFRDPKVLWHARSNSWILIVTAGDHLQFFRSPDLLEWTFAFSWGSDDGAHEGLWECPDMFELKVDNTSEVRWIISVSVDRGAPATGSGMQYFVGDFDGFSFTNENPSDTVLWQNWGQDYYAGITWENVPATDGRRIMIAWADNWLYRFDVPTTPFNGQLTIPRELRLSRIDSAVRMTARPVAELARLRSGGREWGATAVSDAAEATIDLGDAYEVLITFDTATSTATEYGVEVHVGTSQKTRVGYASDRGVVFVDRGQSGILPVSDFTGRHEAPVRNRDGLLNLRILVDRSSIEVFTADGEQLTDLVLPDAQSTGFRAFADGGEALIASLTTHAISRVWSDRACQITAISGEWAQTTLGVQGSSSTIGVAIIDDAAAIDVRVEIIGTRNRNPTRMLGEHAAGVVLGYDPGTGEGVAIMIDARNDRVVACETTSGQEIVSAPFTVRTNSQYRLNAAMDSGTLRVNVDDTRVLDFKTATTGTLRGLIVDAAEAAFKL